jgi:hypothetical protein
MMGKHKLQPDCIVIGILQDFAAHLYDKLPVNGVPMKDKTTTLKDAVASFCVSRGVHIDTCEGDHNWSVKMHAARVVAKEAA